MSESLAFAKSKFKEFCDSRELKDFYQLVQVVHQDGSVFILHHASVWYSEEQEDFGTPHLTTPGPKFIGVSTEHNGDLMFYAGDLVDWWVRN
jgi:hypothetical protein